MDENNGLRDEYGGLIGGLVVEDYTQGIADFEAGAAPPRITSPSYDLGRQKAARDREADATFKEWQRQRDEHAISAMREILTSEQYREWRKSIDIIRGNA